MSFSSAKINWMKIGKRRVWGERKIFNGTKLFFIYKKIKEKKLKQREVFFKRQKCDCSEL